MNALDMQEKIRQAVIVRQRVAYLVSRAWHSIATERSYRFDQFLGTASHGTIALVSHLRAKGL